MNTERHDLLFVSHTKEDFTMLTSLALIFLVSLAMASICQRIGLPRIIGTLIAVLSILITAPLNHSKKAA